MICPNCKKTIDDVSKFCGYCGADIERERAEAKKRAEEQKIQEELRAKRIKKYAIIFLIAFATFIVIVILANNVFIPLSQYNEAEKLLKEGNYLDAYVILENLGDFNQANERILQSKYDLAMREIELGKYAYGYALLRELGSYKNAYSKIDENKVARANKMISENDFAGAYSLLSELEAPSDEILSLKKTVFKKMIMAQLSKYDDDNKLSASIVYLSNQASSADFDNELLNEYEERIAQYKQDIITKANTAFNSTEYNRAVAIVEEGLSVIPNDSELLKLKAKYEEYI